MSQSNHIILSRRAWMQAAAVTGVGLLVLRPSAAFGSTPETAIENQQGSIAAYLAATSLGGYTDLRGIHSEYRESVATFPFALPRGWVFPADSSLTETEPRTEWQRGLGMAEAYFYWQSAFATVAYQAHLRGDTSLVERSLDALESGYNTAVRRAVLQDPGNGFITVEVALARRGNFSTLVGPSRD